MTAQMIAERDRLSLRIGAAEERIHHILRDLTEDEAVLLLLHDGTPPPDAGWASEDECAAFVASAQRKVTGMWADLDGLYGELEALLAAICPDCGEREYGNRCPSRALTYQELEPRR